MKAYIIAPRYLPDDQALSCFILNAGRSIPEAWARLIGYDKPFQERSMYIQSWSDSGYEPREIEVSVKWPKHVGR